MSLSWENIYSCSWTMIFTGCGIVGFGGFNLIAEVADVVGFVIAGNNYHIFLRRP